jgi:hypothetical protein
VRHGLKTTREDTSEHRNNTHMMTTKEWQQKGNQKSPKKTQQSMPILLLTQTGNKQRQKWDNHHMK